MTANSANARVWTNAVVYAAAVGSTAPTDVSTAWAAAWKDAGLISEDGIEPARDMETTDLYAYGGVLVRTVKSKFKQSFKVVLLENNLVVFDLVWPGSTAAIASGIITRTLKVPTGSNPKAFGLHLVDGSTVTRMVYPRGEVLEVKPMKIADNEIAAYEATINVYPTAAGVLGYEITNDAQTDPT